MVTKAKPAPAPAPKPVPAKSTAVAKVTQGAVERPAHLRDGPKRGSENVTHSDLVIPRLELVQALSPARDKKHADYIDGAEEGMLYNSVTRELYGEEVRVVPCYFLKEWLVWKDRKKGGGFRGAFATEALANAAIANLPAEDNPDEFEAMDTAQHFCLLLKDGGKVEQIVISCNRTKMKVSRKWNSLMALSDDDSFAKEYTVSTVSETNKNNQDYYNLKVSPGPYVSEAIYTAGEKLYETMKKGGAVADRSGMDADDGGGSGESSDKKGGKSEF